ncbi:putative multidrug-efflux transporter [Paractinoplanes deccanensis]|uniref:Multidrug efflux pump Tap n=1 Tax=Paractinoplanes deccanensis TaxID=113561 RepID=A0ABQ3XVV2_9ACTN|nr:MFS transporter [Actinoplanes deccanensis]GID71867.1 putative multidrug-efflux transporter [Actinoplanes deccanensis]
MIRRPLASLLAAESVSLAGSHISSVAVPWLVLTTTGSATRVGLVALAQALPFVLAGMLGGPLVDRLGARRVAIGADAAGAVVVGLVPLLHAGGLLSFGSLVAVVAVAGAFGGATNTAKRALLPQVAGDTPMARATALFDGIGRAAILAGLPLGGVLVAALGPIAVLAIDALSFAICAAVVATGTRTEAIPAAVIATGTRTEAIPAAVIATGTRTEASGTRPEGAAREQGSYLADLGAGFAFLRRDTLFATIVGVLFFTNLVDQAYSTVFVPLWIAGTGAGPAALGLLGGVFGLGAVLGSFLYAAVATRLPRVPTFAVCFLIAGSPRMFALAATGDLWPVLTVAFGAGLAVAAVNPILMAVGYERVPASLRGRVLGVATAIGFAGVPLGGLLGGLAADQVGLRATLILAGAVYLAVTLVPFTMKRQIPDTSLMPG